MRHPILGLMILAAAPAISLAETKAPRQSSMSIKVTSSAFTAEAPIPAEFSCERGNTSPPLAWTNLPKETKTLALLVTDPDAPKGTVTHWLVTNLAPTTTSLPAGGALPEGAVVGKNEKGNLGYMGPCPPSGRHHYHFRIYALDAKLSGVDTKADLVAALRGHILDEGELVGTYEKQGH